MTLRGKRVCLTGAGGFIGSHVLEQLLAMGADVSAFIHYNALNTRGHIDYLPKHVQKEIHFIYGDLRDAHTVQAAIQGTDIVLHLGALIAIPYSYLSPTDVFQTNVLGTLNVAQAALKAGVERLVHTSTSETYGTARYVPMDEAHPLQGQSPYAASKIGADKLVESFYHAYDLPVITIRPFNAYGPRQSMRAVIPTIINQALYGDEIRLGNLTPTRDFTFVEDTARAFICAAQSKKGIGDVFNAGSGYEISIGEIAKQIRDMVGREVSLPISSTDARTRPVNSEVNRLFSDSAKAAQVLAWQPLVSLEDGLAKTIEWMRQHRSLYRFDEYIV
ncbi:SDR family NAD(P)-dependent oxidoreductase [Alicyclobacillus fodiniaquatilis]|uniref:SDR family NAD(P)-dependent oxidoreductase n=1 Tax=Alicyclobacillus fodiniaquatilis TaxID=1661150 RepID=A0ABW4JJD7_9BACL